MSEKMGVAKRDDDSTSRNEALLPRVDIIENVSGITLLADLPGVSKDKLNIRVEAENLIIDGEVAINLPQDAQASYAEVRVPRFQRTFKLSKELDSAKVSAQFKNGVLKLRIPKAEHAQPRKIEVQVA